MADLMETIVFNLFLLALLATAVLTIWYRNLLNSIVVFSVFNLVIIVTFVLLQAPDVAMAAAVIGLGLSTTLYILAIGMTREDEE